MFKKLYNILGTPHDNIWCKWLVDNVRSTVFIRLLILADDAELNREMIKFIFEEQYNILQAKDGEEAVKLITENSDRLCLLFLDLLMPKMSGLDVLRFMNEKDYIDYIPVIMITGEATDETDEKAYEYGASDIIYKPFAPNVIFGIIFHKIF